MFLKAMTFIMIAVLVSGSAFAAGTPIEKGEYAVEKGPSDFCLPFTLKEIPDKDDVPVYVSPLHSFYLKSQKIKATSDIDPTCVFREEAKRKDKGNQTVITMTYKEECKGKTVSVMTSRFTLKSESIQLDVVEKGTSGYSCSWARAKK